MHEECTARRTSGTDSISCKYKINIVFVARVSRDNHAEIILYFWSYMNHVDWV